MPALVKTNGYGQCYAVTNDLNVGAARERDRFRFGRQIETAVLVQIGAYAKRCRTDYRNSRHLVAYIGLSFHGIESGPFKIYL